MTEKFFKLLSTKLTETCKDMQVYAYDNVSQAVAHSLKDEPVKALNMTEDYGLITIIGFVSYWVDEDHTKRDHRIELNVKIDLVSPDGDEQLEEGIAECIEWYTDSEDEESDEQLPF